MRRIRMNTQAMSESGARSALGCELIAEAVRAFGRGRLRVFGTSMAPAVLPGDIISIQKASLQEMSLGEIAIFLRGGRLFAHRVIGRTERDRQPCLVTHGDRMSRADAPVRASELIGRVQWIELDGRRLTLEKGLSRRQQWIARVLRISNWATRAYVRWAKLVRMVESECRA